VDSGRNCASFVYPDQVAQDQSEELTRDDVAKVAQLALLNLDDEQIDTFTAQLGAVLERARDLQGFDVDGVPPTAHPYPLVNVLRPDEPEDWSGVGQAALACAPDSEDNMFKVPPALGEEP